MNTSPLGTTPRYEAPRFFPACQHPPSLSLLAILSRARANTYARHIPISTPADVWGSVSPIYLGELLVVQSKLEGPPLLVVLLVRAELLLLFFELPETLLTKEQKAFMVRDE